jgi:hypothetical protein
MTCPAVPDVVRFPADGKNRTAWLSAQEPPGGATADFRWPGGTECAQVQASGIAVLRFDKVTFSGLSRPWPGRPALLLEKVAGLVGLERAAEPAVQGA